MNLTKDDITVINVTNTRYEVKINNFTVDYFYPGSSDYYIKDAVYPILISLLDIEYSRSRDQSTDLIDALKHLTSDQEEGEGGVKLNLIVRRNHEEECRVYDYSILVNGIVVDEFNVYNKDSYISGGLHMVLTKYFGINTDSSTYSYIHGQELINKLIEIAKEVKEWE